MSERRDPLDTLIRKAEGVRPECPVKTIEDAWVRFTEWFIRITPEIPILPAIAPPYPPPGFATLWGIVTDAETGNPIEGIEVSSDELVVISSASGEYEFKEIEPRTYNITFSDPLGRYQRQTHSITLEEGLNRLDVSLTSILCVLRGTVTDEVGEPLPAVLVSTDDYSDYTDGDGFYSFTRIPAKTYDITYYKAMYESLTETVTLSPGETRTLDVSLTRKIPTIPTIMWTRVRPAVITLGETVYIDAQLRCDVPGTYPIDCVINGVVLTQDYTFTPEQVWSVRTFEFTPTVAGTYTASILDAVETFEVKEIVVGLYVCPYDGLDYSAGGEAGLAYHLIHDRWHGGSDYDDGTSIRYLTCPYCSLRISESGPDYQVSQIKTRVVWRLIDHIKAWHSLRCYLCQTDLTFAAKAEDIVPTWASHMAKYHGKQAPAINAVNLYGVRTWDKEALKGTSPWLNHFNATLAVLPPQQTNVCWDAYGENHAPAGFCAMEMRIPELAGKSWTCEVGVWYKDVTETSPTQGPQRAYDTAYSFSGSGEVIRIEQGAFFTKRRVYVPQYGRSVTVTYGEALTITVHYDNEVLVIPNVYWRDPYKLMWP